MPKSGTKLIVPQKPVVVLTMALALPLMISTVPARAQDLFGFLRALTQPVAPAPAPQIFEPGTDPIISQPRPKAHPHPNPVLVEGGEIKKPIEPRHPGEMENPFPALLADSTLRRGDMVMFPDGLRVFTGQVEGRHTLADFKPVAQAGKALSRTTRKLVANLRPGENVAWSMESARTHGKLAENAAEVEVTGSLKRVSRQNRSRSR